MATVKVSWDSKNNDHVDFYRVRRVDRISGETVEWDVGYNINEFYDEGVDDGRYNYVVFGYIADVRVSGSLPEPIIVECAVDPTDPPTDEPTEEPTDPPTDEPLPDPTEDEEIDCSLGFVRSALDDFSGDPAIATVSFDGGFNTYWGIGAYQKRAIDGSLEWERVSTIDSSIILPWWQQTTGGSVVPIFPSGETITFSAIETKTYANQVYWNIVSSQESRIISNHMTSPNSRSRVTARHEVGDSSIRYVGMDVCDDGIYVVGVTSNRSCYLIRFSLGRDGSHPYISHVQLPGLSGPYWLEGQQPENAVDKIGVFCDNGSIYVGGAAGSLYKIDSKLSSPIETIIDPIQSSLGYTSFIFKNEDRIIMVYGDDSMVRVLFEDESIRTFQTPNRVLGCSTLPDGTLLFLTEGLTLRVYSMSGNLLFNRTALITNDSSVVGGLPHWKYRALDSSDWMIAMSGDVSSPTQMNFRKWYRVVDIRCLGYK